MTHNRKTAKHRRSSGYWLALSISGMVLQFSPLSLHAAPNYVVSELPRAQDSQRPFFADMDGDGRLDVLLDHWDPLQGRELYIYLQQNDGKFAPEPSRRVEIKPEIIAVTTAELGDNPGDELIFFTSDAVYSFSSAIESYSGNLQRLAQWPFIASTPDRKKLFYFGELPDINDDGLVDLLLPYNEGLGYFKGTENKTFILEGMIKTTDEGFSSGPDGVGVALDARRILDDQGNIVIDVSTQTSSQFTNFISSWPAENIDPFENIGSLLRTSTWVPAAVLATISNDSKIDLVYLNEVDDENALFTIFTQDDDGVFTEDTDWQSTVETEGSLVLEDFTGDGLSDLIKTVQKNNDWVLYLFKNKDSSFDFDNPDQILRFSGYDLRSELIDLNNDGKPELNISFYTIPALDFIRDVRIQRTRLLFNNIGSDSDNTSDSADEGDGEVNANPVFSRRPDFKLEEKFAADSFLALNPSVTLRADLDNDRQMDYLYIAGDGTLKARTINSDNLQIDADEFWQYVPNHSIIDLSVQELNNDSNPDLILEHSLHFSILISTQ